MASPSAMARAEHLASTPTRPVGAASTPGVFEASAGGFPALSVLPGQFLVKDIALLAAAVWSLGESWAARTR